MWIGGSHDPLTRPSRFSLPHYVYKIRNETKVKRNMSKKKTLLEIISDAKKVHGDKYDYSEVIDANMNTKVKIICPIHGAFEQTMHKHIHAKHGCPSCRKGKVKFTTESYIKTLKSKYGNKYDYSKVEYINNKTKVCVICPKHGEFLIYPIVFLNGKGCKKCYQEKKLRFSEEYVIDLCKKIHNGKYIYKKSKYVNMLTPMIITCPIHGDFSQTPAKHIHAKQGCPYCRNENNGKRRRKSFDKMVEEAKSVHGEKYIYDEATYTASRNKMKIICPTHGEFWQTPENHINKKYGCPVCNESHLENEIRIFLIKKNIDFIAKPTKKIFPWIKKQHLDFYLPKYNVAIECQGKQHYEPTSFGYNISEKKLQENLKSQQERDQRKKKLCEENGINLLYYTNYKNIEEDNIKTFKDKEKLIKSIIT